MLGRQEYEDLQKRAQKWPRTHARRCRPSSPDGRLFGRRRAAAGTHSRASFPHLSLEYGSRLPLDIGGVGIQMAGSATRRSGTAAAVAVCRGPARPLTLEMVAPMENLTAARQVSEFPPPCARRPPAYSNHPAAEGRSGADVISRTVETAVRQCPVPPAQVTRRW